MKEFVFGIRKLLEKFEKGDISAAELVDNMEAECDYAKRHVLTEQAVRGPGPRKPIDRKIPGDDRLD